jgi:ring-1,2-phenylacetyl-CoA epoxidase subunit PaaE
MTTVDRPTRHRSVTHRLTVARVERLTDDAVEITFEVPEALEDEYEFLPGQHVNVAMPGAPDERRSYSICSLAGSGELRIGVKRIPDGVFSAYALEALAPGDELDVMTPAGRFTPRLDPSNVRHYGAIAAGSGITPIMSIVSTALDREPSSKVTLIYGNRTSGSAMFLDELADLKDRYPQRLHLLHVLSREALAVDLLSGRIDAERLTAILDQLVRADSVDEWYLCGPMGMVTDAKSVLAAHGAAANHVHTELFHVGGTPPERKAEARLAAKVCEVTAVLDGRQSTVTMDYPDETVLEAVLRVRNDAPFACRSGVCGTCRARVLGGAVTMERNFALENDETDTGYVLTCQSHPTSSTLAVDYDR